MVVWIKNSTDEKGFFLNHNEGYGVPPKKWEVSKLDNHYLINCVSHMPSSGYHTYPVAIADTEEEAFAKAYTLAKKELEIFGGIDKTSRVAEKDRLVDKVTQKP